MFARYPSDTQIEIKRNKILELKDNNEQIKQLKGLDDYEFTRLVSFPESTEQFKSLIKIIAKDETLMERLSAAFEQFVRFSESYYAGGFVWGTTPKPPQGTKPFSGGKVWNEVSTSNFSPNLK